MNLKDDTSIRIGMRAMILYDKGIAKAYGRKRHIENTGCSRVLARKRSRYDIALHDQHAALCKARSVARTPPRYRNAWTC